MLPNIVQEADGSGNLTKIQELALLLAVFLPSFRLFILPLEVLERQIWRVPFAALLSCTKRSSLSILYQRINASFNIRLIFNPY